MDSLGYVECHGLSGAVVAADKMLKTADVVLSSIQNTKGNGWITLVVQGNLSAVSVAVEAVKTELPDVYVTSVVIGSPAEGLQRLGTTDVFKDSVCQKQETSVAVDLNDSSETGLVEQTDDNLTNEESSAQEMVDDESIEIESSPQAKATCNLCGDPECPRKLGEPHKKCIHYKDLK